MLLNKLLQFFFGLFFMVQYLFFVFRFYLLLFFQFFVDDKIFQICFKYKTSVDEFKPKFELAFALTRGLKDRHLEEITKKTGIN